MAFVAGKSCPVTWNPVTGDGSYYTLNVTGHDWEEAYQKADVTSTGHAGLEAFIVTILGGTGNVRLKHQTTVNPPSAVKVYAGSSGIMRFFVTSTNYIPVPGTILKVNYKSEVQGAVEYSVMMQLNAEVGTYTSQIA